MPDNAKPFHAVRRSLDGRFVTYAVYANNEPFLEPGRGKVLGKQEALAIVKLLNEGPWK